jgi:hypothetical protein
MIIDRGGRLFGRVNIIDAAILVLLLLLIPLAFASYRLFRTPVPALTRVEPAVQDWQPTGLRLRLHGENLRPYLRAFVYPAGQPFSVTVADVKRSLADFLAVTPRLVELRLPDLPTGAYDLYLYDEAQELVVWPNAFRIATPAPSATVSAVVRVVVPAEIAALVKPGDQDGTRSHHVTREMANATIAGVAPRSDGAARLGMMLPRDGQIWLSGPDLVRTLDVEMLIPASGGAEGTLVYKAQRVLVGEPFAFETPHYVIRGVIVSIRTDARN